MQLMVFTDLDGTLLDAATYSWAQAASALEVLQTRGVPVCLVSSKTYAEIIHIHGQLRLTAPFVTENGGGMFLPPDLAPEVKEFLCEATPGLPKRKDGGLLVSLGADYASLTQSLKGISIETGADIEGFSDMTAERTAYLTGLSLEDSLKARARDFDEPFLIHNRTPELEKAVAAAATRIGLTAVQGGRFFHLMGNADKGHAVSHITAAYRRVYGHFVTIGLGDGPNDYSFLKVVDLPVLVGRAFAETSELVPEPLRKKIRAEQAPGPMGWRRSVFAILNEIDRSSPPGKSGAQEYAERSP